MARLRILYIGPHPPSPIAVRPWLFLGALRERHAIDILAPYRPTGLDRLAALRHLPDRAYPLQAMAVESRRMRRAVRAAIADGEYDVIHVEHVRAFSFVPKADRRRVLFDAVDCVSDLFAQAAPYQGLARRRIFEHEARRLSRFESTAISSVARVLVASRRDGAGPPAALLRRRRADIEVTGYVPELGRLIAGAAVAVAPLRYAVGIQNKVLEAMACAIPVVTTSAAVGDLGFEEGGHGFVANDARAFAERICWLLDDRRLA